MEAIPKTQYLKYYKRRDQGASKTFASPWHPKTQKYNIDKLLPHIAEQYNYRITNHLLIKKIICPRRDKIIMHSLEHVNQHRKNNSSLGEKNYSRGRTAAGKHRSLHCKSTTHTTKAIVNEEQVKVVPRKLKNFRKIVPNSKLQQSPYKDAPSAFKQSSSASFHSYQKQNNPTTLSMAMSRPIVKPQKVQKQLSYSSYNSSLHGLCFINPLSGFGSGSTILKITHLSIESNPMIKNDCLIQLELIQRAQMRKEIIRDFVNIRKEKTIKSNPIEYGLLPYSQVPDSGIKFGINLHRIGDFIPLRIWKYTGVECTMVGTVDLPLVSYGSDFQASQDSAPGPLRQRTVLEHRKDNPSYSRKVIEGDIQRKLVTFKMHQAEASVRIKYKVYPKRYNRKMQLQTETHQHSVSHERDVQGQEEDIE